MHVAGRVHRVVGAGRAVGVPLTTQSFVSNGSPTAIVSFDLTGSAAQRCFWGPFNGQPVVVGSATRSR